MTWAQKIGPIGPPTPSNGRKLDMPTASIAQFFSTEQVAQYWAIDAVAVSNFRPFEGVGGPIGPIFWLQVIWSLAPIALMQKKTGQIGLDWRLRPENRPKVSIDYRCLVSLVSQNL